MFCRWFLPPIIVALALDTLSACNTDAPRTPPEQPPPPTAIPAPIDASLASILGIDADDVPLDPPPPAGDFKDDLDAFTSLEACVTSRLKLDPVVGDAVDALGYDTLQRDACRVLEAAHKKDTAPCDAILSTSLRQHCQATVAIVIADPLVCPMLGSNHDMMCVAVARRDDRLCESVALSDRNICNAWIGRDSTMCGNDQRCVRKVQRWKSFLPERIERPGLGTRASVRITEHVDGGTLPERTFDLSRAIISATVRTTVTGAQIEIGDSSTVAWPPAGITSRPRLSFRMRATVDVIRQGKHTVPREAIDWDLLVPRGSLVSSETTHGPIQIDVDMIGLALGDPVRFAVDTVAGPDYRKQQLRIEINTFVSDVVTTGPRL